MKSIKKLAVAVMAMALVFGMMGCSDGSDSSDPVKETVATPTFSVAAGAVDSGTSVIISCATEGAVIHYTTDGSEPTASNATYSAAISVTAAVTLKAIAVKDGMNNSAVASASYTIYVPKYTVGDFVLKTGTRQSKDETPESGTVAAVIVRADTASKPALGVGIVHNRSGLAWCKQYTDNTNSTEVVGYSTNIESLQGDTTSGYMNGSDSWEKVKAACSDAEAHPEYYPAFNYSLTYATDNGLTGALATGWYLPTIAELKTIYENKTVVDASITAAGGNKFESYMYWSCCQESYNTCGRLLYFHDGDWYYTGKYVSDKSVCSVRAFN